VIVFQEDIDAAERWESDWLMAFHPDKCTVVTITNKKHPVKHNYLLHNHTLESVSSAKYLEITLQSDLKWTQHTNNIVANTNKSLGFLKRNLKTSNTNIKSQAYLSLVRPKLEYACSF
jgi:myo-inositol-hexaphosphate 3-phosphohydrolase